MPFQSGAKIVLTNEGSVDLRMLFFRRRFCDPSSTGKGHPVLSRRLASESKRSGRPGPGAPARSNGPWALFGRECRAEYQSRLWQQLVGRGRGENVSRRRPGPPDDQRHRGGRLHRHRLVRREVRQPIPGLPGGRWPCPTIRPSIVSMFPMRSILSATVK